MSFSPRQYAVQMGDVEEISLLLITTLEDEGVEVGVAVAALALTLARLTSPSQPLSDEKGEEAVLHLLDFATALHAQGRVH